MTVLKRMTGMILAVGVLSVGFAAPASAAPKRANPAWQQQCTTTTVSLAGPWKRFVPVTDCTLVHKRRGR